MAGKNGTSTHVLVAHSGIESVTKVRMENALKMLREVEGENIKLTMLNIKEDLDFQRHMHEENPLLCAVEDWVSGQKDNNFDIIWTNIIEPEVQAMYEWARDQRGTRIIADCDDWFMDVPAHNPAREFWHGWRPDAYKNLIETADVSVVSTDFLHEKFPNTILAKNFVIPAEWDKPAGMTYERPKPQDEVLIVCPMSFSRVLEYRRLEIAVKAALEIDNVKLLFMGNLAPYLNSYPVGEQVCLGSWFDLQDYLWAMPQLKTDIWLSPLEECDFNKAKSNLKWIEAAMSGACVLGQKWGELETSVEHAVTGYLAEEPLQWKDYLIELCNDAELRQKLQTNARQEVLTNWTWDSPSIRDPWKEVFERGKRRDNLRSERSDVVSAVPADIDVR